MHDLSAFVFPAATALFVRLSVAMLAFTASASCTPLGKPQPCAPLVRSQVHCYAVGKCYLVGAGPCSDLMTVKAARLLQHADVVVYDDLAASEALQHAGKTCQQLYVGKRGGQESIKQSEINELLVQLCQQGKHVVRLKGGCPSVFSRVASEMTALATAGCPYELVPGVSSILAAPLFAGFPLTEATLGSSFTVVSGHDVAGTDWSIFARVPTLVILMAGRSFAESIATKLMSTGWAGGTQVCVIKSAGLPQQRVWRTTLYKAAADLAGEQLSPCIVIVGQITAFPEALAAKNVVR